MAFPPLPERTNTSFELNRLPNVGLLRTKDRLQISELSRYAGPQALW